MHGDLLKAATQATDPPARFVITLLGGSWPRDGPKKGLLESAGWGAPRAGAVGIQRLCSVLGVAWETAMGVRCQDFKAAKWHLDVDWESHTPPREWLGKLP